MNDSTKQNIRAKVNTYIKRAEEIKNIRSDKSPKKQAVASNVTDGGNSRNNKNSDDENEDPDQRRMMQKFEGWFYHIYSSNINITAFLYI